MRRWQREVTLVLCGLALPGCSASRSVVATASTDRPVLVVELVGGEVDALRPDGVAWDDESPYQPEHWSRPSGHFALAGQMGLVEQAANPRAPDPTVSLLFNGRRVEAPPSFDSLHPSWQYRFLIDPDLEAEGIISLAVSDDDGEIQQSMGSRTLTIAELTRQPQVDLGGFGSVRHLYVTVQAEPYEQLPSFSTDPIPVAAELAEWVNTGIELLSGMHVAVAAEGRIRLSRLNTGFWGPAGVSDPVLNSRWQGLNLEGFEGVPHGALVACIVDPVSQLVTQKLTIGDGILTRIDGSGVLLLGVNDTDVVNNAGIFQVRVGAGARVPAVTVAPRQKP